MARALSYVMHEYAGFLYRVWLNDDDSVRTVEPVEGQHRAASKDKHIRAARETYYEERGK